MTYITIIPEIELAKYDPILSELKGKKQYQRPVGWHTEYPFEIIIDYVSYFCSDYQTVMELLAKHNPKSDLRIALYNRVVDDSLRLGSFKYVITKQVTIAWVNFEKISNEFQEHKLKESMKPKCRIKDTDVILNYRIYEPHLKLEEKTINKKPYMYPAIINKKIKDMVEADFVPVNEGDYLVYHGYKNSFTAVWTPEKFNERYEIICQE